MRFMNRCSDRIIWILANELPSSEEEFNKLWAREHNTLSCFCIDTYDKYCRVHSLVKSGDILASDFLRWQENDFQRIMDAIIKQPSISVDQEE